MAVLLTLMSDLEVQGRRYLLEVLEAVASEVDQISWSLMNRGWVLFNRASRSLLKSRLANEFYKH